MAEHIRKTIEEMQAQIRKHEVEAAKIKVLVNQLCGFAGMPVLYPDADLEVAGASGLAVRRNSFFGRPLTTVVREYLDMRHRAGQGAAKIEEIVGALKEGGYDLSTVSAKGEGEQKRGVAISLAKNSPTFIRLPTGDWGLLEWYPNVKKKKTAENGKSEPAEEGGEAPEDDGETLKPYPPADSPTGLSATPALGAPASAGDAGE